jgi:hypothetical protein
VVNDETRRISSGTACARITSLSVGASVPLIGFFDLGSHHLIGEGACVLTSNTVPAPGVLLAGCTLPLYAGPGVLGGLATSNSVFNPFDVPGFRTGSIWTVRVFDE